MSYLERILVKAGSNLIPQKVAIKLSKAILATQGIGWAGPNGGVNTSGEFDFLKRILKEINNPLIFDVGANTGEYTICCLRANEKSRIHCFEPSKAHRNQLKINLAKESFKYNNTVIVNPYGLSDTSEERSLFKDEEITG